MYGCLTTLCLPMIYIVVCAAQSLVFCVVFGDHCLSFCLFSFAHCKEKFGVVLYS